MGVYVYTLRKATKNINVDGTFQPVHLYEYAYKDSRHADPKLIGRMHTLAYKAWESAGNKPTLALLDERVILVTSPMWYDTDEWPGIEIGRVERIKGRLYCVAQNTTVELAENSLRAA